ncbi:MAG: hypothetical protein QW051_00740 [Candidatus Aenigmatarchaeota archaeon]
MAGSGIGLSLGLIDPFKLYGDQVTKDPELLKYFSEIFEKYGNKITQGKSYQTSLDVNGDGKEDKIKFSIEDGSIIYEGQPVFGKKFRIDIDLYGKSGTTSLMCILEGNKPVVAKTQWAMDSEVPKYLKALLEN